MNVGIIVYSKTGHTLFVATQLQEALATAGHTEHLDQVDAVGSVRPNATDVPLQTLPETEGYDAIVFGAPTWGGAPAPPMASYLKQVASLEGRKAVCLVTGLFPPGLGRNQCLARMTELCESKGATICGTGSVGWLSFGRKRKIAKVVESLAGLLQESAQ
jgi:multimeric flavodoxin WrbA